MRDFHTLKYAFKNKCGIIISLNTTISEKNLDIAIAQMRKEFLKETSVKTK